MALSLRRITSSTAYIPEVDGIRFIAILLVVLYHTTGDLLRHSAAGYVQEVAANPFFWFGVRGSFGVQMFFVVSGFVLALPFAASRFNDRPAPDLKRYYLRRLTRLEPPYIGALLMFFFLKILGGRGTASSLMPHLIASILYQHNLVYGQPSRIEFVAWTLEIEVQFYLLAPLIAAIAFRGGRAWSRRISMLVAIVAWGYLASRIYPLSPRLQLSLFCYLQYFLAGFVLADLYVHRSSVSRHSLTWDLIAIAGLAAPFVMMRLGLSLDCFAPVVLLIAYYAIFRSGFVRDFLSYVWVSTIGGMCYSIYLIHNYAIASAGFLTEKIGTDLPFPVRFGLQSALLIPIVLAASVVFFVAIERPCMKPDWPGQLARWLRLRWGDRQIANAMIRSDS